MEIPDAFEASEAATTAASSIWKGRPKRPARRFARDLRMAMPGIAILSCVAAAGSMIVAVESLPIRTDASTGTRVEPPDVSAPALDTAHSIGLKDSAKAPPVGSTPNCVRPRLFHDFE